MSQRGRSSQQRSSIIMRSSGTAPNIALIWGAFQNCGLKLNGQLCIIHTASGSPARIASNTPLPIAARNFGSLFAGFISMKVSEA